jgi:poly(3-hydroxybutyrate) depolymerase
MTQALTALLDYVSQGINIDQDRISVSGINNGASGAWKLAIESPGRFSAIMPVVTDGQVALGDERRQVVGNLPGRVFIKQSDAGSIDRMNNLMAGTKQDWQLTKLGQNVTALGDIPAYRDRQLLKWLSQQRRKAMARS